MVKWNISKSIHWPWEPRRPRILIKTAEKGHEVGNQSAYLELSPVKIEISDFLYSQQIASYILKPFLLKLA